MNRHDSYCVCTLCIVNRSESRRYHVVAINERTGMLYYLTLAPVTHKEGCTILSKQVPHKNVRKQLMEVK